MKLRIRRTVALNKFMNVRHSWPTRASLGAVLGMATFALTFETALAAEMFHRAYHRDQFKTALRRISFYARRSWLGLSLSRDRVYVFCNGLSLPQLTAMRRFLLRRASKTEAGQSYADLAYVSALMALQTADHPEFNARIDQFGQDADHLLKTIQTTPSLATEIPEEKDKEQFSVEKAAEALADFSSLMAAQAMPWFVLSGTFLGIVREGGFLAHDYDIDVGVMADTADLPRMTAALQADPRFHCSDLETQASFERDATGKLICHQRPVFLKISHQGGIHIDIFVHYHEGGAIWHASSLFRWDNSAFDLAPYDLAGVAVLGPADADRYLTENYGTWRVPLVDFNSALDTTNQQVVRNPLSVAIFLRRIWLAARANPAGANALLRALVRAGYIEANATGGYHFIPAAFKT